MVVIILILNALKNLLHMIYILQQVKMQNPQTTAKTVRRVLHVFKGKESSYQITFTITLLFIKVRHMIRNLGTDYSWYHLVKNVKEKHH